MARFEYEITQRNFGVGDFVWRDLKTSDASALKVLTITKMLTELALPYYLSKGSVGSFQYVKRPQLA